MASKNPHGSSGKGLPRTENERKEEGKKNSTKDAYNKKKYKSSPNVHTGEDDLKKTLFELNATSRLAGVLNSGNKNVQHSAGKHKLNTKSDVTPSAKNSQQSAPVAKKNSTQTPTKTKINVYDKKNQASQYFTRNPPNICRHPGSRMQSPRPPMDINRFQHPHQNLPFQHGHIGRFQQPQQNLSIQHGHNVRSQKPPHNLSFQHRHNFRFQKPQQILSFQQGYNVRFQQTDQNSNRRNCHVPNNSSFVRPPAHPGNTIPSVKYKIKKVDTNCKNLKQSKKMQNKNTNCERKRKRKKKNNLPPKEKETDSCNVTPLLCFTKKNIEPEENPDLMQLSDDDSVNLSQNSVDSSVLQNFDLIDFSDENDSFTGPLQSVDFSNSQDVKLIDFSDEDSNSSYDSDESDITSETSVTSSTVNSEISFIAQKASTKKEAFISVFWDIENCSLPIKKSAVDFANYVRDTFYEGRTEVNFTAACDVSCLNSIVVRELDEASITLIHISSFNKNAADKKIVSLLQRFQMQYRKTNSAIVLITGDSDFSHILRDMRYQHHIFINLICNVNTRQSLITAADKYEIFDDIVNKIPDRNVIDNTLHVLTITNLPEMKPKLVKSSLSEKLKSFNCRIRFANNISSIEVIFKDRSICEKAANFLKGYYLGGKLLNITFSSKYSTDQTTISERAKKHNGRSSVKLKATNASKSNPLSSSVNSSVSDPFGPLVDLPQNDLFSFLVSTPKTDPFGPLINAAENDLFGSVVNAPQTDPFGSLVNAPQTEPFGSMVNAPQTDPFGSLVNAPQTEPFGSIVNAPQTDPFGSLVNAPQTDPFGSLVNASQSDTFISVDEKSLCKGATLCVFVSMQFGDIEYWKEEFVKIWNTSDFSLQWEGSGIDGYFLVRFKSLKKAQKAKKVLGKIQPNDQNAPRFFKLIKHEEDLCSLKINDVEESNKRKITEHIQIIEKKKLKYLRSHEKIMKEMKSRTTASIQGTSEAVHDKLSECKEQMDTFISFSEYIKEQIKKLSFESETFGLELNELLCDFTRECNCISSALPIYAKKTLILRKIQEHQVIIIRAETGSGKSTQLTQYLWRRRDIFGKGKIICTQPRKIAAVSLAKHVSSQIGCKLGDIVGYQVGMSKKMSENTGILYVTDFTMLKLLVNEGLTNISCIIIDEAHERTIYTDILLGMIKKYLPSYPHIKVIITSATIDTSIFRDYFSLTESSVLQISGRMFPVEDVWLEHNVKPDWDYLSKTINTAIEILAEEPGDILAFLVTPLETEKACENFNEKIKGRKDCKKVRVFNLHGKLDAQEQQKVFEKLPEGMRKVVFATNCAETSITIPGIKYVIDCGFVKESQYDAVRNMNILSVSFVSKSSAKQRSGRAGRTQVGKCYHLYSKANYELMSDSTDPEILRINLGEALLKLMKMGISDPIQFDFVQSPPIHLLKSTMKQLLYLKAVDESNYLLTDLGNKMAVLPLEPRLGHLILKGFDNDLGYEAVTVAALITVSNTIFFRTSENKDEADKLKKRFCESENDFLTYLDVYKEWVDIPKNRKSQWCVMNCINARSLKVAHELISEIILTLQRELSYKVRTKFNDNSNDLLEIIFHSFSQNLAVYSGHFKFGYKSLSLSDRLLIHPGSSVSTFCQSTPQYVVYGTILKTSQTFMVNVCPVTRSMILDAIGMYDLNINLKSLDDMIASVYRISPLGQNVIVNNFIGKKGIRRKELENKFRALCNSDLVEIDINMPKGLVQVIGYGITSDQVRDVITPVMDEVQQKLLMQEKDICLFEDSSPFTGILLAGGCFKDVILPGEFRDIKVILKEEENIQSVAEKLSMCGSITEIREWQKYFKITFDVPSSARKALETYSNESRFSLKSIEKTNSDFSHNYRAFISFVRRKCTGLAFITLDGSTSIVGTFPPTICYRGSLARISRSKKTNDICISNLPADADRKDLQPIIVSLLPPGTKISKFIIVRLKPFESSKEEMDLLKMKIFNLFAEFTYKENIKVVLKKPSPKDFTWNGTVFFMNALDGETAVSILKNRRTHADFLGSIMLDPTVQTYLYCKPEVFSAVKDDIEEALQFFKNDLSVGRSLDIIAVPKGSNKVEIKITSNNVSDITDARRTIYTIISGDEIKFSCDSDKEKLFTDLGKTFLKNLGEETESCYIFQNIYSKTITVFGKVNACNYVKMQINTFLKAHENEEYKDISLKTEYGKSVLKELYKNYGFDFQKLKDECNITDIQVNKYKQILTIQGTSSSVSKCESVIQDIKKKFSDCSEVIEELCPVCYDEVSEEKYRLEFCGHSYCTECFLHLLQSSEDIPLKCEKSIADPDSGDTYVCNSSVVVADLIWAFNGRKVLQKNLSEKFLRLFVESREDISFCPSPDCPMIFRVTKDKMNIFRCPACTNDICTKCEEIYHSGISCSMNQCLKMNKSYSLEDWMKEDPDNRKKCPSCSAPIEKNGGCNHMTCWKCKCHMCWLCLQVFPTGDLVYNHQPYCPKKGVEHAFAALAVY